jgi:hypothetical protein
VEFVASEVRPEVWSSLSYLRDPMSAQPWSDSGQQLFMLIRAGERADSAIIDLGTGDRWLTSRLYIFSAILSALLGVGCLVFLETRDGVPRRFVGVADPDAVRSALIRREPWLAHAFVAAHLNFGAPDVTPAFNELKRVLAGRTTPLSDLNIWELDAALRWVAGAGYEPADAPQAAEAVAARYRDSPLLSRVVEATAPEEPGWVRLGNSPGDPTKVSEERASWIASGVHLERLVRDALTHPTVEQTPGTTLRELHRQVVLRDEGDFVAIVDTDGRFERLLNRRRIAEHLGREVAEQSSR